MTQTLPDEREDKLPRWARETLAAARREAAVATSRLAAHLETVEPTTIWYGDWENRIYIPTPFGNQTVYFSMTGQPSISTQQEVGVGFRRGKLHISGGHSVVLEPIASNCFDVNLKD